MLKPLRAVLAREFLRSLRRPAETLNPLLFYLIVITLVPLATEPTPALLQRIGPGIIWIAALLAALLSADRLFRDDYADGSLEQQLLAPVSLIWIVYGKVLAHWLLTGLPAVMLAPLLGMMLGLPAQAIAVLSLSLLLGTPVLALLTAVIAALTAGLRGGGALFALLLLPLMAPVLIFATGASLRALDGLPATAALYLLAAMLVLSISLLPLAIAAAIRVAVE